MRYRLARFSIALSLCVAVVSGTSGCRRPAPVEPEPGPKEQPPAQTPPTATAKPIPSEIPTVQTIPQPPVVEPDLPPDDGVYYALERISVPTDDGVTGYPIGTKVLKVGPRRYEIDGHEVEIAPSKLTKDVEAVRQLVRIYNERVRQARLKRRARVQAQRATPTPTPTPTPPLVPEPPAPPPEPLPMATSFQGEDPPEKPARSAAPPTPDPTKKTATRVYEAERGRFIIRVQGDEISE